jgi:hypothetical protein
MFGSVPMNYSDGTTITTSLAPSGAMRYDASSLMKSHT